MDKTFKEKCKYVSGFNSNIKQSVCMTGHLLDKNIETICNYIDVIKFSNYGFSERSYEMVHRGVLKYQSIKSSIDSILRL